MPRAFIHTFGCKVNQYDSQLLRDALKNNGYTVTDNSNEAEVVIINTCTVTAEADRQAKSLARSVKEKKPLVRIVVTGCLPKTFPESQSEVEGITYVKDINAFLKLSPVSQAGINHFDGHSRAFVKIQDGCDAFCSYCIVPYARNIISSREISEVVSEVARLVDSGCSEVVLCGIRLGKYSFGLNKLLNKLLEIKREFRIRLSSLEVSEVNGELLALIKTNDKICPHLHIPMQSGSDRILKLMNRPYSINEYLSMVGAIKSEIPDIALTTDIMVGFPDEREDDFEASCAVVNKISFSRLHVFRYSIRPGTKAAAFDGSISGQAKKARSKKLLEIGRTLEQKYLYSNLGKIRPVILESNNTILTDNYIHLKLSAPAETKKGIFRVKIFAENNAHFARPV